MSLVLKSVIVHQRNEEALMGTRSPILLCRELSVRPSMEQQSMWMTIVNNVERWTRRLSK